MLKKKHFLQSLFAWIGLKRQRAKHDAAAANDVIPEPQSGPRQGFPDHGGDAWNITLSATANEHQERLKIVGQRQHQNLQQPDRCA